MKQLIVIISFVFFGGFFANAQKMSVSGKVLDTSGTVSLQNAMVMMVRIKDSMLVDFTRTDASGNFSLKNLDVDTFSLVISHPRFDEKTIYIFGDPTDLQVNIPQIRMPEKAKELQEIMIYANKNPVYYKGDTLVYTADSFKVAEGAVVEDLLKKLPGIKVDKDGKITSQGQTIDKVLVDGDEFFGSDPTVATKNLAADGVDQVRIYKEKDNETIGGSETEKNIMDLRLKEEARKGYFGRLSGASDLALTPLNNYFGTSPFYEGELLFNKFNSKQKLSVFALGSNTPRSNFGRGDMNKFGLSNEDGANGNFWEQESNRNTSGVPQTLKAGVYYSNKFGEKQNTDLLFNYSYYNDRLDARSSSRSQYFLTDTTYYTDDSTRNYTENQSHRINLTLSSQVDSLTLIEFKPSVRLDKGINQSADFSDFTGENGLQSLATEINNNTSSTGLKLNGMARVYRKFKKKRRELEVRYDLNSNNNQNEGLLYSRAFYPILSDTDQIDQLKTNNNRSIGHFGSISYFEPLSKRFKINFNYLFEYGTSEQDRKTYDGTGMGNYTTLREDLTNNFSAVRLQHRVGTELIYEFGKHTAAVGTFVRNIDIQNINLANDSVVPQNITNILPKFKYTFKPSMSKTFTINYMTSSSQPSISDLQPIPDNTNPNRIRIGNSDLRPNYVHQLNINFNSWNALSGKYIWSGGSLYLPKDAFGTETTFDQFGRTISRTVNVDGNVSAFFWLGGGIPILNQKLDIQPSLDASFNRYVGYIGGQKNTTDNFSITPELTFELQLDSLEIELGGSVSYTNPKSSLSTVSNTPYTTENYFMDFTWRLKRSFGIEWDASFTRNSQPGDGFFDYSFFLLNVEFSKKFLPTRNLTVAIRGNDILNQNINAQREVVGNKVTDYRTTIISRYFLLKVTYRFNNRKTKEDDFKGWH